MKYFNLKFIKITPPIFSFILIIICYCAFYPGSMTWDSVEQLRQARLNEYGNWQPPMMAFLWRLLLIVNDGPAVMLLLHMAMIWLTSLFLYFWAFDNGRRWGISFLLIPFLPWIANFEFVIWKDVALASSWALATAMALYFSKKEKFPILVFFGIFLLFLYGFLVRANSLAASIFLLPFLASCIFKKNSLRFFLFLILFNMAIFLILPKSVNILLDAKEDHPFSYVMYDDLVALKLRGKDISDSILSAESMSDLKACALRINNKAGASLCVNGKLKNKQGSNYNDQFEDLRINRYSAFKAAWISAVTRNFWSYLNYRFDVFIYLSRTPELAPYYSSEFVIVKAPYISNSITQQNSPLGNYIIQFIKYSEQTLPFLFKPYFWIFLSVVLSIVLKIFSRLENIPYWMLPASGAAYIFGYYPVTPSNDFRYIYWACMICTISVFVLINKKRMNIEN